MITVNFYSFADKKPKENQDILIVFNKNCHYGNQSLIQNYIVEYVWYLVDQEGMYMKQSYCGLNPPLKTQDKEQGLRWELYYMFNGYYMTNDMYWCPVEEFYSNFPPTN